MLTIIKNKYKNIKDKILHFLVYKEINKTWDNIDSYTVMLTIIKNKQKNREKLRFHVYKEIKTWDNVDLNEYSNKTSKFLFSTKAFFWLHSPILCDAPKAWAKHFEVESETLHLYQPKPDLCTPEIQKIDGSWFTDKSPIRDLISEWLDKSKLQYQTKIDYQEAYLDRCIAKAKGFLESNSGGIYQESPIHEHMTNNSLPDGVFELGVLSYALFFLQLKKSGLLTFIIPAIMYSFYSLFNNMSNSLYLYRINKMLDSLLLNKTRFFSLVEFNNSIKEISNKFINIVKPKIFGRVLKNFCKSFLVKVQKQKVNYYSHLLETNYFTNKYTAWFYNKPIDATLRVNMLNKTATFYSNPYSVPVQVSTTKPSHKNLIGFSSERLIFRPLLASDFPAYLAICMSEAPLYNSGTSSTSSQSQLATFVQDTRKFFIERKLIHYAMVGIFLKKSDGTEGELIGDGGVFSLENEDYKWPEVYYVLKKEFWNKGYATEFLKRFLDVWWSLPRDNTPMRVQSISLGKYFYHQEVKERLVAEIHMSNIGSRRVIEKAGFVFYGYLGAKQEYGYWVLISPN